MKKIIQVLLVLLCSQQAFSQHVYQIRADSVRIYNVCDTAELIIENRTRGVSGFLYNKGNGVTEFRRIQLESVGNGQIAIIGQDTLDLSTLPGIGGIDTIYRSGNNIIYVKKGVQHTINLPAPANTWQDVMTNGNTSSITPVVNPSSGEGLKILHDDGFISGYTGNGFIRNGFLRFGNSSLNLYTERNIPLYFGSGNLTRLAIMENGNIGIGTTSPSTMLDVNGAINSSSSIQASFFKASTPLYSSGGYNLLVHNLTTNTYERTATIPASMISGNVGTSSSWQDVMSNGNTSTITPIVNPSSAEGLRIVRNGAYVSGYNDEGTTRQGYLQFNYLSTNLFSEINAPVIFGTNGLARMTIAGGGQVGIGGEPVAGYIFKSYGNSWVESQALTTAAQPTFYVSSKASSSDLEVYLNASKVHLGPYAAADMSLVNSAGAERMTIKANGNVGIGTISPSQKLEINGGVLSTSDVAGFAFSDRSGVGGGWTWYSNDGKARLFDGSVGDRLVVDASGNVGIGTTSPTYKMHVVGATYANGFLSDLNPGLAVNLYANANIVAQSGSYPSIGFHKPGVWGSAIYGVSDFDFKIINSGGIVVNLWNGGNDGAGSGLDADLFDGVSTENFVFGSNGTASVFINGGNLNALTKSGFYNGSGMTGAPGTDWYNVIHSEYHDGGFANQIAQRFTGNDNKVNIFARTLNSGSWGDWQELWHSGNAPYPINRTAPQYGDGNSLSVNDLPGNSTTFAYSPAGTPTTGPIISFGGFTGNAYDMQIMGSYNSSAGRFYMRTRNGDNGTWNTWRELWHSGNFDPSAYAPASGAGNYIQNQNASAQSANGWISGNFTVGGQIYATAYYQSSLRSLKKNIIAFTPSAVAILNKAQVRSFQFKSDSTGHTNIGFIADEVPDEMSTPGRKGVDQASTVGLLVKSVQELSTKNEALEAKVQKLEALIEKLLEEKNK